MNISSSNRAQVITYYNKASHYFFFQESSLYFFTVSTKSVSLALQVELFSLSLFSFPTGCVLPAALWVKRSNVSVRWDLFSSGFRRVRERKRVGSGRRDYNIKSAKQRRVEETQTQQ